MGAWNFSLQNQTSNVFNGSESAINNLDENTHISGIVFYILVALLVVLFCGIAGNILSFVVLIKLCKSCSFYLYLAFLAISDTCVLVCYGMFIRLDIFNLHQTYNAIKQNTRALHMAVVILFSQLSSWIIVAVTIDRYVAVCHPFKATEYCTRKRAVINICVMFLVSVALIIPFVSLEWNVDFCVVPEFTIESCFKYAFTLHTSTSIIVPFCLICGFNTLIIRGLYNANQRRGNLTSGRANSASSENIRDDGFKGIIKMLFGVTFLFLVCCLPAITVQLYAPMNSKTANEIKDEIPLAFAIAIGGILLNHCSNFILYGLSGHQFRSKFVNIFCCKNVLE